MNREDLFSRRNFFSIGGLGALALATAGSAQAFQSDELSDTEKANVAVVDAFHKNMSDPAQNLDKVGRLKETCADDIIWGTANGQKLYGLTAVMDWYINFFKMSGDKGLRTLEYEYSETFAKGPVVVEYGLHFVIPPGGPKPPPTNVHCVVHIVRDGKIMERYDNSVRQPKQG
jgi:hypothetical protein